MVVVDERPGDGSGAGEERVDLPSVVRARAFAAEVLAGAVNRPVQLLNGSLYVRGLLEHGARESLEPMVTRLGGDADYEPMQQFLAVRPRDPGEGDAGGRGAGHGAN